MDNITIAVDETSSSIFGNLGIFVGLSQCSFKHKTSAKKHWPRPKAQIAKNTEYGVIKNKEQRIKNKE
jgi:hypothetical protein